MARLTTAGAPTARPYGLLAGGEQHEPDVLLHGEQHGGDLLVHGEQAGTDLLGDEHSEYDVLAGGEYRARRDLMSAR